MKIGPFSQDFANTVLRQAIHAGDIQQAVRIGYQFFTSGFANACFTQLKLITLELGAHQLLLPCEIAKYLSNFSINLGTHKLSESGQVRDCWPPLCQAIQRLCLAPKSHCVKNLERLSRRPLWESDAMVCTADESLDLLKRTARTRQGLLALASACQRIWIWNQCGDPKPRCTIQALWSWFMDKTNSLVADQTLPPQALDCVKVLHQWSQKFPELCGTFAILLLFHSHDSRIKPDLTLDLVDLPDPTQSKDFKDFGDLKDLKDLKDFEQKLATCQVQGLIADPWQDAVTEWYAQLTANKKPVKSYLLNRRIFEKWQKHLGSTTPVASKPIVPVIVSQKRNTRFVQTFLIRPPTKRVKPLQPSQPLDPNQSSQPLDPNQSESESVDIPPS